MSALKSLGSDTGVKKEDVPRLTVIGRSSRSPLFELLYLRLAPWGQPFDLVGRPEVSIPESWRTLSRKVSNAASIGTGAPKQGCQR